MLTGALIQMIRPFPAQLFWGGLGVEFVDRCSVSDDSALPFAILLGRPGGGFAVRCNLSNDSAFFSQFVWGGLVAEFAGRCITSYNETWPSLQTAAAYISGVE